MYQEYEKKISKLFAALKNHPPIIIKEMSDDFKEMSDEELKMGFIQNRKKLSNQISGGISSIPFIR